MLAFAAQSMKAVIQLTGNFPVEEYAECQLKLAKCHFIKQPPCLFYRVSDRLRHKTSEAHSCLGFECCLPALKESCPKCQLLFKKPFEIKLSSGLSRCAFIFIL